MLVACCVFDVLDETLDVLLLVLGAYHKHIIGIYDDVIFQSAYYGYLLFGYGNQGVARVVCLHCAATCCVGILILA